MVISCTRNQARSEPARQTINCLRGSLEIPAGYQQEHRRELHRCLPSANAQRRAPPGRDDQNIKGDIRCRNGVRRLLTLPAKPSGAGSRAVRRRRGRTPDQRAIRLLGKSNEVSKKEATGRRIRLSVSTRQSNSSPQLRIEGSQGPRVHLRMTVMHNRAHRQVSMNVCFQ